MYNYFYRNTQYFENREQIISIVTCSLSPLREALHIYSKVRTAEEKKCFECHGKGYLCKLKCTKYF